VAGLRVRLYRGDELIADETTDADGRIREAFPALDASGTYRLIFDTGDYFAKRDVACFYPEVAVCFAVSDPRGHYHVPLLLSPFAYSTYRGS
jgi:5-hydroxyisourate hydrolase